MAVVRALGLPEGELRVVAVAAHPDDIEIACGGLLLRLARRGARGSSLTMTGSPQRRAEAEGAARAFWPGATTRFVGLADGRLPGHWLEVKEALHDFAAEVGQVDLVLAPSPQDAHQDHRLVAELASTVWRDALVLRYEIPKWDGDMGRPNTYVAISDEDADRKVDLLFEHYRSQAGRDWWDREMFLGLMRLRGMECRHRYAEAFTVVKSLVDIGGYS